MSLLLTGAGAGSDAAAGGLKFTVDATSGWAVPANSTEWTALLNGSGISNPSILWNCQESAGNLIDSIGTSPGVPSAGCTHAQSTAGWSRLGIKTGNPSGAGLVTGSVGFPDIATTSMMSFAIVNLPAFTSGVGLAQLSVLCLGPNFGHQLVADAEFDATVITRLINDTGGGAANGGATANGTFNESGVIPLLVQWNKTANSGIVQTSLETITSSTTFLSGTMGGPGMILGGDNVQSYFTAGGTFLYVATWFASAAEVSALQRSSLISLIRNGH